MIDDERGAGSGLGRRVGETSFGPVSVKCGFGHSSLRVSLSPRPFPQLSSVLLLYPPGLMPLPFDRPAALQTFRE